MLVCVEASARGGGFAAGRAVVGAAGLRPAAAQRLVGARPFPKVPGHGGAAIRNDRRLLALDHAHFHRFFGGGLPAAGVGVYYGYGGYDYTGGYAYPAGYGDEVGARGAVTDQGGYFPALVSVVPVEQSASRDRGVCRSQAQVVASESGGQRTVTITRC